MKDLDDIIIKDGEIYRREVPYTAADIKKDIRLLDDRTIDGSQLSDSDLYLLRVLASRLTQYSVNATKACDEIIFNQYVKDNNVSQEDYDLAILDDYHYSVRELILQVVDERVSEKDIRYRSIGAVINPITFQPVLSMISRDGTRMSIPIVAVGKN